MRINKILIVLFCLFCCSLVFADNQSISSIQSKGYKIIKDQTFDITLENWGKVKFITFEQHFDGPFKLEFFLSNDKGNVIYKFPDFYGNIWCFESVLAVAFRDINKDGLKDVIVIADYITGIGPTGVVPFSVCGIYFQVGKEFKNIPKLDDEINEIEELRKDMNINTVVKYTQDKVKYINNLLNTL